MKKNIHKRSAGLREILGILFRHSSSIRYLIPVEIFFLILDGYFCSRIPALVKHVVDGLAGGVEIFVRDGLLHTFLYGLGISFGWFVSSIIQHYLKEKNSYTIMVNIQLHLFDHLQSLGMDFYQNTYIGEITGRLTNDMYQSVKEIYISFTHAIWLIGLIVPSMVTMAGYNMNFFYIFLVMMFCSGVFLYYMLPLIRAKQRLAMDQMGRINAKITESIYSIMLVKSFAREKDMTGHIQNAASNFLEKVMKAVRIRVLSTRFVNMCMNFLAPAMLLCLGVYMRLELAVLVGFYTYWVSTGTRIQNVMNLLDRVNSAFASFDRVFEFFEEKPLVADRENAEDLLMCEGTLEFRDVCFSYNSGPPVIRNVSFRIKRNSRVALVGRSGSGKTTIINLLLRFFDPQSGGIFIDGQGIRDVRQKSLRNHIGLVMQETFLLNGSVRDNLKFVKPDSDDAEMMEALRLAQIWDYFRTDGKGLDTPIGERGVKLSGGQRQRISIARIFLKDPEIVLLDEATSAMDSETEQNIFGAMERLMKGRTSIIISHRLSSIQDCDAILMLDHGRLVDSGPHEELVQRCSLYRELCRRQELSKKH